MGSIDVIKRKIIQKKKHPKKYAAGTTIALKKLN
jgi:hypothetical protein